jgi:hypothetical protein
MSRPAGRQRFGDVTSGRAAGLGRSECHVSAGTDMLTAESRSCLRLNLAKITGFSQLARNRAY